MITTEFNTAGKEGRVSERTRQGAARRRRSRMRTWSRGRGRCKKGKWSTASDRCDGADKHPLNSLVWRRLGSNMVTFERSVATECMYLM